MYKLKLCDWVYETDEHWLFMKTTYHISGMTCPGCVTKIRTGLLDSLPIQSIDIDLSSGLITLESDTTISNENLATAVSTLGPYHLEQPQTKVYLDPWYKIYQPVLVIVLVASLLALVLSLSTGNPGLKSGMRYFMGMFFVFFASFKLIDLSGFADSYSTYDLLASKWPAYGFMYPFLELGIGLALIASYKLSFVLPAMIILMSFSSIGVIRAVSKKEKIKCACLGTAFNLPMSTVTIVEDVAMVVMGLIMYLL